MARRTYCDFCGAEMSDPAQLAYPRMVRLLGLAGTLYTTSSMDLRGRPEEEYGLSMDTCYDCMQLVLGCVHGLQHRSKEPKK